MAARGREEQNKNRFTNIMLEREKDKTCTHKSAFCFSTPLHYKKVLAKQSMSGGARETRVSQKQI
jgi:hypothetical protein